MLERQLIPFDSLWWAAPQLRMIRLLLNYVRTHQTGPAQPFLTLSLLSAPALKVNCRHKQAAHIRTYVWCRVPSLPCVPRQFQRKGRESKERESKNTPEMTLPGAKHCPPLNSCRTPAETHWCPREVKITQSEQMHPCLFFLHLCQYAIANRTRGTLYCCCFSVNLSILGSHSDG